MLRTVFSGIQPTGQPHLGNYLGAIRQWKKLSLEKDSVNYFSIVNLHALTGRRGRDLGHETREMMAVLLASGIDPERAVIYPQSSVRQHTELAWILNCSCPVGRLLRMTSWKSKEDAREPSESKLSLGLLSYSVLQAADILLFRATHVPVGQDQLQHLELTRDLADAMNRILGTPYFPRPESLTGPHARIASLRNPMVKMSKSSMDPNSRLLLTDEEDTIKTKIKSALTDSDRSITYAPETRPGISNLITIWAALTDTSTDQVVEQFRSRHGDSAGHAIFKKELGQIVVEHCRPIRQKYLDLIHKPEALDEIAAYHASEAAKHAEKTMVEVRSAFGLR